MRYINASMWFYDERGNYSYYPYCAVPLEKLFNIITVEIKDKKTAAKSVSECFTAVLLYYRAISNRDKQRA